jgi:hypothetical protein
MILEFLPLLLAWLLGFASSLYVNRQANKFAAEREQRARLSIASAAFRAAFVEAIFKLTGKVRRNWERTDSDDAQDYLAMEVVRTTYVRHLEAIEQFRPYIPECRKDFDLAADNYQQLVEGYLKINALDDIAEGLALPDEDQKRRKNLLSRIYALLSYSKNT